MRFLPYFYRATIFTILLMLSTLFVFGQTSAKNLHLPFELDNYSRIRSVIKGRNNPQQIPEKVAFELFMRTVADGNARGLIEKGGFDSLQAETILSTAYQITQILEISDRHATLLKIEKQARGGSKVQTELLKLQRIKDDWVTKAFDKWLPESLGRNVFNKFRDFVNTEVKSGVQKVLPYGIRKQQSSGFNRMVNGFATRNPTGDHGELYIFVAAWNDDGMVFGSASVSEQYESETSYRASVSITSPFGRINTSSSDWGYSPVVYYTGISTGPEDDVYIINATIEEQEGSYDEFYEFYGGGSTVVEALEIELDVPPSISLTSAIFSPPTVPAIPGTVSTVTANVVFSLGVPVGTTVDIEINSGPLSGNPLYVINPTTFNPSNGGSSTGNGNQSARLTRPALPLGTVQVNFPFQISQNSGTGTIMGQVRIGNPIPPNPLPSPGILISPPVSGNGLIANLIVGTPPPNPSPSPVATNCNPGPLLLLWCANGGGEWNYPPPSTRCGCSVAIEKSPIVIDTAGNGFSLTNSANGVWFDLFDKDSPIKLSWTSADSDDGWLALDRNLNNRIDNGKELFGNATDQPPPPAGGERQGFLALAEFDKVQNGGNQDGKITRRDSVFKKLRIWIDKNHNGISEPEELFRLPESNIVAVRLDYQVSDRVDQHGNRFKYRARVRDRQNANVGRWAWDVFLTAEP